MNNKNSLEARIAALEARNEEQHKEVSRKLEVAFDLITRLYRIIYLKSTKKAPWTGASWKESTK